MKSLHTNSYSGLSIIIDKPSRFDETNGRLMSGLVESWFDEEVLPFPLSTANIYTADESPVLNPCTTHVALLGPKSSALSDIPTQTGYPTLYKGIPAITGFFPQDCLDFRAIESEDDDNDDQFSERETKDDYPTRRSNYRFWTKRFVAKLLSPPKHHPAIQPIYSPIPDDIVRILSRVKNENFYLDIETSRVHKCITCIGISADSLFPRVYVIPVYLHTGARAYHNWVSIYRALSRALIDNTVVIHNAAFDLLVLHAWYKFPLPSKIYDTLLAQHRIFPEAEKSLSHAIACWTSLPYHKDTNTDAHNASQERRLWEYNAKDVYALKLIKDAQLAYAAGNQGLLASIDQANSMIVPYLETSITGLRLDELNLAITAGKLKAKRDLFQRMASILSGESFNPASPKQCAKFFHDKLGYKIVARTATGAPKIGRKQLYQLKLKHDNPLLSVIIKYRETAKDLSMLECELWRTP